MEDLRSRMDWVQSVAQQFHNLMTTNPQTMDAELAMMAAWVGTPDSVRFPDESPAR